MKNLKHIWHWVRWPLAVLVVLYVAVVIYRIPALIEKDKTQETVARIHAAKITLADVEGKFLPPQPYAGENDATVAGIDKNNNGIRDDVELAIFEKYPISAKVRAAELQYALTEQMFLNEVFNTETWKAVAEEDSRAFQCLGLTIPRGNTSFLLKEIDRLTGEVQSLVFNTQSRKDAKDKAYNFTTSNGDAPGSTCDIDLNTLPN